MTNRTGTELQRSERADLIKEIIGLKEEASAAIIPEFGADDDDSFQEDLSTQESGDIEITGSSQSTTAATTATPSPPTVLNKKDTVRRERATADKERDEALDRYKRGLLINFCSRKS